MKYLVVSVDGEIKYSRPSEDCSEKEQLEIYQEFRKEYPKGDVKVEISSREPFMGW